MKRLISLLLCVVMCLSVFAGAAQVLAVGNASDIFTVTNTGFIDNEITYTIKVSPNQSKITGAVVNVTFDSSLFDVVTEKSGAAGTYNEDGDLIPFISGMYVGGVTHSDKNVYSFGYINATGYSTSTSGKDMFTITFRGKLGDDRPVAEFGFDCVEFVTDDNNKDNDIKKSDSVQKITSHSFLTLEMPVVTTVNAFGDGLKVSWTAVQGAESYKLYRKAENATAWTLIKSGLTENEYVDNEINKGTKYAYTVSAVNGKGETPKDETGVSGLNFGSIASINAVIEGNGALVTWSALAGAEKYEVYRKTANSATWQMLATVAGKTSYKDTTLQSGIEYSYKVKAFRGEYSAELAGAPATVKYIAVPVVKVANVSDGIEISFKAVGGAKKYIVEKKSSNGTFEPLTEITANGDVKYLDKDVVVGGTYTYRVQSVADGLQSEKAVAVIKRVSTTKITSCYNEVKGVQLKWNAVSGAESYKVYRKLPAQTSWTEITTTSALSYQDTNVVGNTIYQYVVTVIDQSGSESAYSAQRECRFIATPKLLTRENAVGGVKITWEKVAGATSYRIYRRGAGTNYWFYLGDFPATLNTFTDYETANYFPGDKNKNEQAKPKSGNYYRYTVRASYDGKDSSGKDYLIYSGFDTDGLYLKYVATPKLTSISNATGGLQIKWNAVNGGGRVEYRVYRRGAGSTYWKYLGTTTSTTWTDAEVKSANGAYYRYTVRAVQGTNGSGWYSAFDTNGLFLMRLANPTLKSAVSSSAGITVKWGSVKGATSYYVYRKTANSGWTRIATVNGNANTTYLDKTAKKGVTYVYTVRAVYGKTTSYFNSGISCKDKY